MLEAHKKECTIVRWKKSDTVKGTTHIPKLTLSERTAFLQGTLKNPYLTLEILLH